MAYFTQAGARQTYEQGGVAQGAASGGVHYQRQTFVAPEPPLSATGHQPNVQPQSLYVAPEATQAQQGYGGFDPAQAEIYGADDYGYDSVDELAEGRQGRFGRLAAVLGAAASLALVVGISVWGYKLVMRDVSGVPVVRAVEGPMRIQPENPGGRPADHQGLAVNAVAATGTAEDPADRLVLAPQPIELTEDDRPLSELAQLAEQDRADQAEPVGGAVSERTMAAYQSGEIDTLVAQLTEGVEPLEALGDRGEQVKVEPVSAPVIVQPEPLKPVEIAAVAAAPQPSAALLKAPGVKISLRPNVRPARFTPAADPGALATTASVLEVSPDSLPAGTRLAQLGAYESAEVARAEWDRIYAQFEDYLADKKRVIQRAESGGRTFYRLRAMGFDGLSDARRFCSALVAGNADCIPVTTR
ncbi:SPOR domain-containing protein [Phycobacter azelaicus]|uniref:SPOR domain-containing protein n=1 Tax=Phycobacter azelaicus TaxID=2668075 RepID=UPI001866B3AD|nr:SPOR domain-containing protein [Phycobacter azelaicus]